MAVFTRVDKTTVSDTVIDQIMDLIRTGQLKAGERLPSEHGLVELLGVGRSSVREALKARGIRLDPPQPVRRGRPPKEGKG